MEVRECRYLKQTMACSEAKEKRAIRCDKEPTSRYTYAGLVSQHFEDVSIFIIPWRPCLMMSMETTRDGGALRCDEDEQHNLTHDSLWIKRRRPHLTSQGKTLEAYQVQIDFVI